jgi:hypothetical protein
MSQGINWIDRLRIERFVWALDQQIYDLPRASRIARRREVRDNLLAAARDVGTTEALRRLGSSRRLAHEYLAAELGDGPRHSWIAAAYFAGLFPLILLSGLGQAASAYQDGITAVNPHVTGTFTWHGIDYLQTDVTFTFVDGNASQVGGAWTPLTYAIWILGTVLIGRLWRLLPWISRRRVQNAA